MYTLTTVAVLFSTVVGAGVGLWLLAEHRQSAATATFGLFMLSIAVWSAAHLGTLVATTKWWLIAFNALAYVGVVSLPVLWFLFACYYTDRGAWLSRTRIGLLAVVPALTLALVATAPAHDIFYTSIDVQEVAGHPALQTSPGPWHVVNVTYAYSLLFLGTALILSLVRTENRLYRFQSLLLVTLATVPWGINLVYHLGVRPVPWIDLTPVAFVAIGVPLALLVVTRDAVPLRPIAYRRVVALLGDPVVVTGRDGRIVDANQAAHEVFGEELEGREVGAVFPDCLLEGTGIHPDLAESIECSIDVDGTTRHFLARERDIDPARSRRRGSIVVLTDITVQQSQQAALQETAAELRRKTDDLERKNAQLERLAEVIAHDMRTPVSTASKTVELLRRDLDDPDPDVGRSLETLETVTDRLQTFVEELPRLARESTDVESTTDCDLATLAESAWRILDTGEVALEIEDTRSLEGDPSRLQQVFENLFRNSLEHGHRPAAVEEDGTDGELTGPTTGRDGTGATVAEASADGDRTGAVTTVSVATTDRGFYVEDDGPGIPASVRDRLFEFGTTGDDGEGFGLAIVRAIVEAHGWTIEVGERNGGGARFVVDTRA